MDYYTFTIHTTGPVPVVVNEVPANQVINVQLEIQRGMLGSTQLVSFNNDQIVILAKSIVHYTMRKESPF